MQHTSVDIDDSIERPIESQIRDARRIVLDIFLQHVAHGLRELTGGASRGDSIPRPYPCEPRTNIAHVGGDHAGATCDRLAHDGWRALLIRSHEHDVGRGEQVWDVLVGTGWLTENDWFES